MKINNAIVIVFVSLLMACRVNVPQEYTESADYPQIYPDYINVTVPVNIAPLSFEIVQDAEDMLVRYSYSNEEFLCGGMKAQLGIDDWKSLVQHANGMAIKVEVYVENNGKWTKHQPFNIYVSPDSIDSYLSYRYISLSDESYEEQSIKQRCLENYDESVIFNNVLNSTTKKSGQCINCQYYQQYNPERMQFYACQNNGGLVIVYDGKMRKINLNNDIVFPAGIYSTWHPWLPLIVYSTNPTLLDFDAIDSDKIEEFDAVGDLIAFDVEKNEVTNIGKDDEKFGAFPLWAPDGKTLYYCSAHIEQPDSGNKEDGKKSRTKGVKYNIYKKSFNPDTWQFGPQEIVFDGTEMNSSATLPRISPDGCYMLFTMAKSGAYHTLNSDADLWMMDLQTGEAHAKLALNSDNAESCHAWSSNGRWIVFSSSRDNGRFRPFIAHVDRDGKCSRPFELPSADADYHRQLTFSYINPEFTKGHVAIKPQQLDDILKTKGEAVKYVPQLHPNK